MRLFTAIALPGEIREKLDSLVHDLRPTAKIKWSRAENLHVTTKFIGEWPAARLEELTAALRRLAPREPIAISVRGVGWFPNARAPRVFWAGVEAGPGLAALARDTDSELGRLGIERERRKFSPHLTLARIRNPASLERLTRAVEALPASEFGSFTADRFHLYLSELRPTGAVYTSLAEFPFQRS